MPRPRKDDFVRSTSISSYAEKMPTRNPHDKIQLVEEDCSLSSMKDLLLNLLN